MTDFFDFASPTRPVRPYSRTRTQVDVATEAEEAQADADSTMDVISASLAQVNPISAAVRYGRPDYDRVQKGYNPFQDDADKINGLNPELFVDSFHPETTDEIIALASRRAEDAMMRERHPVIDIAAGVGGTIGDPFLYMMGGPVGMTAKGVASFAAREMLMESASEAAMHGILPDRTIEESALEVGFTGVGAGVVGGALAIASNRAANAVELRSLQTPEENAIPTPDELSAGAAQVEQIPMDELDVVGSAPALMGFTSPAVRRYRATNSQAMRMFMNEFAPLPMQTKAQQGGRVASAETAWTRAQKYDEDAVLIEQTFDKEFRKYRQKGGEMDKDAFAKEVAWAMRNGESKVPEAEAVYKVYRELDDELYFNAAKSGAYGKEAQELARTGDKPNLIGAKEHLQRLYRRDALLDPEVRAEFRQIARGKIIAQAMGRNTKFIRIDDALYPVEEDMVSYVLENTPGAEVVPGGAREYFGDMDVSAIVPGTKVTLDTANQQADRVVNAILRNFMGGSRTDAVNPDYIVPKPGTLHERTFSLFSDNELSRLGLLVDDARDVMHTTSREMRREQALQDTFGERTLTGVKEGIAQDYEKLVQQAEEVGDAKTLKRLETNRDKDMKYVDTVRDMLLGTYGIPRDGVDVGINFSRYVRLFNTITLLPVSWLGNITDIAAPALRFGAVEWARNMAPFVTAFKQNKQIANELGLAVEGITGQRAKLIMEGSSDLSTFQQKWLNLWARFSGMNLVTDLGQTFGTRITISSWRKMFNRLDNLKPKEISRLAEAGIDVVSARLIKNQMDLHGKTVRGAFDPNVSAWDDQNARSIFENAIRNEVRSRQVFEPAPGDTPFVFERADLFESGKLLGQFVKFMYGAQVRWGMLGLQRRDAEFLSGYFLMTALGGLSVSQAKDYIRGKDITEKESLSIMLDSIDRGGALGLLGMIPPAVYAVATGERSGRYIMKEPWALAVGPTGEPLWRTVQSIGKFGLPGVFGEATENDAWRIIKSVPFLNTMYAMDLLRLTMEGEGYRE